MSTSWLVQILTKLLTTCTKTFTLTLSYQLNMRLSSFIIRFVSLLAFSHSHVLDLEFISRTSTSLYGKQKHCNKRQTMRFDEDMKVFFGNTWMQKQRGCNYKIVYCNSRCWHFIHIDWVIFTMIMMHDHTSGVNTPLAVAIILMYKC